MLAKHLISDNSVCLEEDDNVGTLIGKIEKNRVNDVYLCDKSKFRGVFSHYKFLKSHVSKDMKVARFIEHVHHLNENDNLVEIAKYMLDGNTTILPVCRKDKFLGIVNIFGIFKNIHKIPNLERVKVANLNKKKIVMHENEGVGKALSLMNKNHLREIPTLDEKNNVSGIIRHIDLIKNFYRYDISKDYSEDVNKDGLQLEKTASLSLPVSDFLEINEPTFVNKDDSLIDIAQKMAENNHLICIEKETNQIITERDILNKIVQRQVEEVRHIQFVGMDDLRLTNKMIGRIKNIATDNAKKFLREVHNIFEIVIHFKKFQEQHEKPRYEVHIRIDCPGGLFATKKEERDIILALREGFDALHSNIKSKFN